MNRAGKSNIDPDIWGPYYWKVFHFTAFGYPNEPTDDDKKAYKDFYLNFSKILPCDSCTNAATREMETTNWEKILSSREVLIRWTYNFHEEVNIKLDKKSPKFRDFEDNFVNDNMSNYSNKLEHIIIILTVIGAIIFAVFMLRTLDIL